MVLQYFVNSSETGARIPVDIDRATDADHAAISIFNTYLS